MKREQIRLGIRATELFDAIAIQRLAQDPQISQFIYWDDPFPSDGGKKLALAALRRRHAGQAYSFSIFVNRRFAGMAAIDRVDWQAGAGHLFYWLGVPYWNRGVGGWAVGQLVQRAQQWTYERRRLAVLYANCLGENEPSMRILRKNGFIVVSQFLGNGDHGGKFAGRRWVRFSRALN